VSARRPSTRLSAPPPRGVDWLPHALLVGAIGIACAISALRHVPSYVWLERWESGNAAERVEALQRLVLRDALPVQGSELAEELVASESALLRELAVTAIVTKYSKRVQIQRLRRLPPSPELVRSTVWASHLEGMAPLLSQRDLERYFKSLPAAR